MKHIYRIVHEKAGGHAIEHTEYLESSRRLNQAEELLLKKCLEEARTESGPGDLWDITKGAASRFKDATGRELRPIADPFAGTVTF